MGAIRRGLVLALGLLALPTTARALDLGALGAELPGLRATIDLSERVSWSDADGGIGSQTAIGFDLHKVFSTDTSDVATATLQGYLVRIEDLPGAPPFFDGPDDWEFQFRIFNLNWTPRATRGRLNLRVGHMELPYGLEHRLNTNGTLRDFTHGANLGIKADWGVSLNGVLDAFEYELAWTRGVADERTLEATGVVSGRIGTPSERPWILGLSFLHGRVSNLRAVGLWRSGIATPTPLESDRDAIRRTRIGIDLEWNEGPIVVLAELSGGVDFDQRVWNGLVELDWNSPYEDWLVYGQLRFEARRFDAGWDGREQLALGVRWAPDEHWALSTELARDLDHFGARAESTRVRSQLRYRF